MGHDSWATPGGKKAPWVFGGTLLCATAIKLLLAFFTYGTNDVMYYSAYAEKIANMGGVALYRDGVIVTRTDGSQVWEGFWHPPLTLRFLAMVTFLQQRTGLPFPFLCRLPYILADIGTAVLLWKLLRSTVVAKTGLVVACTFAGSPILIMLSGFHGNPEPLVVFLLTWTLWLLETRRAAWLVGLAYAGALSIKLWPAVLAPVIVFTLPDWRARFRFAAVASGTWLLSSMPELAQEPALVLRNMLGYQSVYGVWGTSRFVSLSGWDFLDALWRRYGSFMVVLLVFAAAIWAGRKTHIRPIYRFGFVTSLFLVFTPGFGIQYLAWVLPWMIPLGAEMLWIYSIAAGIFMFHVYTTWSGGFPWFLADSTYAISWSGFLIWHEVLCWLVVLLSLILFAKEIVYSPREAKQ